MHQFHSGDKTMATKYPRADGISRRQYRHHYENWSEPYEGLGGRGWREGLDDAMWHGEGQHAGRGPRGYTRSDERIQEDINERLTRHPMIDATDVEVSVQNGEVTLRGYVDDRSAKRLAEDIADTVFGVKDVNNQLRLKHRAAL
jgi:BON domain